MGLRLALPGSTGRLAPVQYFCVGIASHCSGPSAPCASNYARTFKRFSSSRAIRGRHAPPLGYTSDHELANEMLGRSHAPCWLYGIATCAYARFMRFAGVYPRELMLSSIWLLFAVPECAAHLEAWCWRVPPLCTRSNPPLLTPTPH